MRPIRLRTNPERLGGVGRKPTGKRPQMRAGAVFNHYPLGGWHQLEGEGRRITEVFPRGVKLVVEKGIRAMQCDPSGTAVSLSVRLREPLGALV